MRLLDGVAQSTGAFTVPGDGACRRVTGPADFAPAIRACPLRYVLSDDLTAMCAQLAFAEGHRLSSCLDLARFPAPGVWIEWNDAVHQRVARECGVLRDPSQCAGGRVGVLIEATPCGRRGMLRTFWSEPEQQAVRVAALETHIELEAIERCEAPEPDVFAGGFATISDRVDPALDALMKCARFRFDPSWLDYFAAVDFPRERRRTVIQNSLSAVGRDVPLLLGFFLLLGARHAILPEPMSRARLNRKRQMAGHAPLLDHIELHAALTGPTTSPTVAGGTNRRHPRLHHVRGHLVRRHQRVFWRVAHLRGSVGAGRVQTRTVCLSFDRRS